VEPARTPQGEPELVLDRYRLLARLGAGGFGEVWRARDELLQREVAVKRIRLGPELDSERATREAHASARLSHPAIVALYEACAVDGSFFLISELVDGHTLAELIAADCLEDEEILEIALALTGALGHAHARGVIHRDIKPHNVLVPAAGGDPAGAAKLADFGGASLAGEDALTRTGDVLGTLAYMAPEQSEGREVGEEADLYSLALVLYEALCGVNPVRGATPAATARRIGSRLEPLERRRRDLPRGLTRALDRALDPSPGRRGTLNELARALADGLEQQPPRRSRPGRQRAEATVPLPPRDRPRPVAAPVAAEATAEGRPSAPAVAEPAEPAAPSRRLALPRALWLGCALALVIWEVAASRPGVALLAAAALLPLLLLPRRSGPTWLACVLAPALGTVGLAGAFPAIAGQPRRWLHRGALGALGYWWLTLAEPLLSAHLWLGERAGTPPRAAWESSLSAAASHVVGPLIATGVLLGALLWAVAAVTLPWLVRGRNAALDLLAAALWSGAVVWFAPAIDGGLRSGAPHPEPRGAVLGAVLGAAVAVAARAVRGPVRPAGA
jgi:hypothetical protein